jgi:hypothetical protein
VIPKRGCADAARIEKMPDAPWKDEQAQCRKEKVEELHSPAILPILERVEQPTDGTRCRYNEKKNAC